MRDIPINDDNLADRFFFLAMRMAIDASADLIAANTRIDVLQTQLKDEPRAEVARLTAEHKKIYNLFTEMCLDRDKHLREVQRLREGVDPLTNLFRVAERAHKLLLAGSRADRRETAADLGAALIVAEKHVDLIPF